MEKSIGIEDEFKTIFSKNPPIAYLRIRYGLILAFILMLADVSYICVILL